MIHLVIPGDPQAQQRHRTTKSGHTFTPTKTADYKRLIVLAFQQKYPDFVPITQPLVLLIKIYRHIPQSVSKKKRERMMGGRNRPAKTPDWDNFGKIVSDALNQVAYVDDKQVVTGMVEKWYSDRPRLEIEITRWEADNSCSR